MKRRPDQEREDATAREQAEARREALLADLKAREAAGRAPEPEAGAPPEKPAAESAGEAPEAAAPPKKEEPGADTE